MPAEAKKAAAAFKPDAVHCLELGVIDGIVPEPEGGAHTDTDEAARLLGESLREALEDLESIARGRPEAQAPSQIPLVRRLRLSQQAEPVDRSGASRSFRTDSRRVTSVASPQHPQPYPPLRNDFGPETGPKSRPPAGWRSLSRDKSPL